MNGYHFGYKQKLLEKTVVIMVHADQPNSFAPKFAELVTQSQICHPKILFFFFGNNLAYLEGFLA